MVEATFDVADLVGYRYRVDDYYEVGREKIREYARAVQDFHPAHWSEDAACEFGYAGLVAPTTFISTAAMLANRKLFETVISGYDVFVQTDQVFEAYKPVLTGDRLISDVELTSVRRIAGKDLLTVTNTFADQTGEVVQIMHTTVVGITGEEVDAGISAAIERVIMHGIDVPSRTAAAAGQSATNPVPQTSPRLSTISRTRVPHTAIRFEDVAIGSELPARIVSLTRGDLVNYAGVSGDANPIHWHDGVAALANLPDVIAHGMLTMGLGAGFVTGWLGDPGALTRYGVRLSNYTIVEAAAAGSVEFTGRVKSLDPGTRTAVVVIVAKSAGRKVFGLATAEVRLA
ncbi:fused (3R)-hydroxyacyl-ACP dehydratase subunits HadA/HadB [Nocardia implantans]|uniref:Fused (3R)-hydroxyacyl-ACP dehydratase subunits HadA/HadB n=1 Tax=Nocardia implantans TaxID=3108168 RepID=A0ABU6AMT3_9NOCA|nr:MULTISPECIES: fused (3R)-hydroxyacyl-ACP dehydratase subunits HadA/HadB [unclassified Nocardia]MBF6193587.1 MaoC family dehydratase N-terminal domain-containing protein [Nocardia beijingensis]MEA3532196.1 fused (3R)-hydroxyacyl-ACP dehydratase subunits HadA/HadB [Nocardia sp. CDC192]MEB3508687.1 fused (3R)-hydroxyacyl-ACP dehydratase subunits HadA/HadB [Nocardia sp. CDC186]